MIALQVIPNPQSSKLVFRSEFQDILHHFNRGLGGMAVGNRSFSIQASLPCFLVFLFPTIKAGTRDIEFPAGFGDTQMRCKVQYNQFEPDPQFFSGFFVHTSLLFVASILLQSVSVGMTYYSAEPPSFVGHNFSP